MLGLREVSKKKSRALKDDEVQSLTIIGVSLTLLEYLDDYETHFFNKKHFPTDSEKNTVEILIKLCENFNAIIRSAKKLNNSTAPFEVSSKLDVYLEGVTDDGMQRINILTNLLMDLTDVKQPDPSKRMRNIPGHCASMIVHLLGKRGYSVTNTQRMEMVNKVKTFSKFIYNDHKELSLR